MAQGHPYPQLKNRPSSLLLGSLLLSLGILVGLVIAASLDWMPFGQAVPKFLSSSPSPITLTRQNLSPTVIPQGGGRDFVEVAKSVKPAVVNIFSTRAGRESQEFHEAPFEDPFRRFFQEKPPKESLKERGLGSGVIVGSNGVIMTNNHVVNQAQDVKVFLADNTELQATLVGVDPKTDLAILKVEAEGLPTIPWADSDQLEVGEFVLAVGSPFGLKQTVTMGIVSAVGRAGMRIADYEDFIQTDAAINPGNSGGALVNAKGELIGINTAIVSRNGGSMGIGFAVPSNLARGILTQIVNRGKVVRGWLGVSIQNLSMDLALQFSIPDTNGVLVSDVLEDSPALQGGFQRGDVIIAFDGKTVTDVAGLRNLVAGTSVGKQVAVRLIRDRQTQERNVLIAEQPSVVAQVRPMPPGNRPPVKGVLAALEVTNVDSKVAHQFGFVRGERGVVIVEVLPGTVAAEAGVKVGDLILEVNRAPVPALRQYQAIVANVSHEQTVLLLIQRQGRASFLTLKP